MKNRVLYLNKITITCLGLLGLVGAIFYSNWIESSHYSETSYAKQNAQQSSPSFEKSTSFQNQDTSTNQNNQYSNNNDTGYSKWNSQNNVMPKGQVVEYDYSGPGYYVDKNNFFKQENFSQSESMPYGNSPIENFPSNNVTGFQSFPPSFENSYPETYNNSCCDGLLKTVRLEAGAAFGDYIGLHENYREAGLFVAPRAICNWQPFLDLRDYRFKNGTWAASAGIGFRRWNDCCTRLMGINLYYDYRETLHKQDICDCICEFKKWNYNSFNRIGVGLEYLGGCVDFRVNGYFPVGTTKHRGRTIFFNNFANGFSASVQPTQFIRYGVDGEVGRELFNFCGSSLYAAVGGYYFDHKDLKEISGPLARLELNWKEYLTLEFRYSYDRVYHSRFQGKFLFRIPLENLFCCKSACDQCWDNFLLQPVRRFGVPFIDDNCCWKWNW